MNHRGIFHLHINESFYTLNSQKDHGNIRICVFFSQVYNRDLHLSTQQRYQDRNLSRTCTLVQIRISMPKCSRDPVLSNSSVLQLTETHKCLCSHDLSMSSMCKMTPLYVNKISLCGSQNTQNYKLIKQLFLTKCVCVYFCHSFNISI